MVELSAHTGRLADAMMSILEHGTVAATLRGDLLRLLPSSYLLTAFCNAASLWGQDVGGSVARLRPRVWTQDALRQMSLMQSHANLKEQTSHSFPTCKGGQAAAVGQQPPAVDRKRHRAGGQTFVAGAHVAAYKRHQRNVLHPAGRHLPVRTECIPCATRTQQSDTCI